MRNACARHARPICVPCWSENALSVSFADPPVAASEAGGLAQCGVDPGQPAPAPRLEVLDDLGIEHQRDPPGRRLARQPRAERANTRQRYAWKPPHREPAGVTP